MGSGGLHLHDAPNMPFYSLTTLAEAKRYSNMGQKSKPIIENISQVVTPTS